MDFGGGFGAGDMDFGGGNDFGRGEEPMPAEPAGGTPEPAPEA